MKNAISLLLAGTLVLAASCTGRIHTPEESSLFEPVTDPVSGVVSYALKYGAPDDNRQSLYFVTKSMTEDGRYLLFWHSDGNEKKGLGERHLMLADLKTDTVHDFGLPAMTPFVETRLNYMVYGDRQRGFFRRNFDTPDQETKLCDVPTELSDLGVVTRLATHLTLTQDRKKAFLDAAVRTPEGRERYLQGLLDLETGAWDLWGETEWNCNHGQLCPIDDSLAMCAWESAWEAPGHAYQAETGWYPRMWLVRKGSKTLIPAEKMNFASHEIWDDDGKGVSWCGHGRMTEDDCVYHVDLATGQQERWAGVPGARHNNCSPDNKYVVCDQAPETWWRGCRWAVAFWNRETEKYVFVYTTRDALMPQDNPSRLHPDPHPHFVMNGRYIVSTANNADGHMDLYITPVKQLVEMTQ
ncbi:MAG: hypothetical protein K6D54_02190 [Bacteroidales bacterium]|nr:hypothetical protein [Bacteroidales bacterium]